MDHGIYQNEKLMMVCGSKEKAEEMLEKYPGGEIFPVEYVKHQWIKKS